MAAGAFVLSWGSLFSPGGFCSFLEGCAFVWQVWGEGSRSFSVKSEYNLFPALRQRQAVCYHCWVLCCWILSGNEENPPALPWAEPPSPGVPGVHLGWDRDKGHCTVTCCHSLGRDSNQAGNVFLENVPFKTSISRENSSVGAICC